MPTYVFIFHFTSEGQRAYKESVKRSDGVVQVVENLGGRMKGLYWTSSKFDGLWIAELPNDEAAAAVSLSVTGKGFVQASALRAFDREEFSKISARVG